MNAFLKILKDLANQKNKDGEISMAKLGGTIMSISGVIVMLPTLGVTIPAAVVTWAGVALAVGAKLGWDGMRNGIDKNGPIPPTTSTDKK